MTKKKATTTAVETVAAPTTAALAKPQSGLATVKAMFEKQSGQLGKALAGQIDTERFVRTALTAYSNGSAYFQSAHPVSLLGACMQAASLGLSVDSNLGEYWLIPRRNNKRNCVWISGQLGYKGLIKLARRNANFLSVHAELVREGDFFEYNLGSEPQITHRKQMRVTEAPEIIASYAVVRYKQGPAQIHVSPLWEIYESRERSESYRNGQGPWIQHFAGMCLVTPLRAILKLEAIDDVVLRQLGREDAQEVAEDVIEVGLDGDLAMPIGELPPIQIEEPSTVDELKAKFGKPKAAEKNPDEPA